MAGSSTKGWQFWIDRGGTFTDVVARSPDGQLRVHKLLSVHPHKYDDAAVQGIRDIFGLTKTDRIPSEEIECIRLGTTIATNALLEHKGERTLLVTTRGFADAIRIGYQNRPQIFALDIVLPKMLYEEVIEVEERIRADGTVECQLDLKSAQSAMQGAFDRGFRSCAIVLMHGYRYPQHEQALSRVAREIGFEQVCPSHATIPLMKYVSRGDTTLVDAYLSPLLRRYVEKLSRELGDVKLFFMQSNGGLAEAHHFRGKDAILSGPAGGIVAAVQTALQAGFEKIISFDMGGTSTDVAHFDGEYERSDETQIAGVRIRAPMLSIHTVAAGGGSIVSFDGARFRVGPDSAGAFPGPACYGNGGPLTITDCNLVLGRIKVENFSSVFGPDGNSPLDVEVVRDKFVKLAADVTSATGRQWDVEEIASGFIRIAIQKMANAIKQVSTEKGKDVSDYALQCFGGAGGQHACALAESLGIKTILLHPLAGVLSAYGIGLSPVTSIEHVSIEAVLDDCIDSLPQRAREAAEKASAAVREQTSAGADVSTATHVYLRVQGSDFSLPVPLADAPRMVNGFWKAHRERFGFEQRDKTLVVERVAVEASEKAQVSQCESIAEHAALDTVVVEAGWEGERLASGVLCLKKGGRTGRSAVRLRTGEGKADPITLELFNNLFMFVAEQMGVTLQSTSHSVNIKERLDFSCALFDGAGNLIANAPHIPVHLGSMGESVQELIKRIGDRIKPGDVYALNDPYHGGTHLPDITVIAQASEDFFVAARGHHADIGGITPGSMPPNSKDIAEEGVLIDMFPLVLDGVFQEQPLRKLLAGAKYPARNIEQNIADLKAQIAATTRGIGELKRATEYYGTETMRAYSQYVQDNAGRSVIAALRSQTGGTFKCTMDSGAEIHVAITVSEDKSSAVIDFTGTSAQSSDNFNAPLSVCKAAVLYVFRTLCNEDIPLNAGCMRPVRLIVPDGCMLNPKYPAAVVAGNVETSQIIVDCLYGALGVLASSQGTMNNFTFGDDTHQYYETICGGAGAGDGFEGASAVQTHMTNSRLTDPEVLEHRFPVLLEEFSIRRNSGGKGKFRGGDGVVRKIRFLKPMQASILSNRRSEKGFGLRGGLAGKTGINSVVRTDRVESLSFRQSANLNAGDVFVIETPGGGAFGTSD